MSSRVAVIGAGYVGLPLAVALAEGGRSVTCIDVSADAVRRILAGDSYISDVPSEKLHWVLGDASATALWSHS